MITANKAAVTQRLISLDALRGFTIIAMIIVNDPGSHEVRYTPLSHSWWHGITPTDFVFPFFVFMVGISIVLSLSKQKKQEKSRADILKKVSIRSIKIFALGVFLNLYPYFDLPEVRIMGVLQRIALVFFACSLLFMYTDWKTQLKVGVGLLVGYWLTMILIPVPGVGAGVLEPDLNFAHWVDSYLVPGRMHRVTWDPEGVYSTLPAIATGVSGMLAGWLLLGDKSREQKIIWLFLGGFACFAIGNFWDYFFPINKPLWSSSYVMYTSGLGLMLLASFVWLVDVQGYTRWIKPGLIFGANAISAYALSVLLKPLYFKPLFGMQAINDRLMNSFSMLVSPELSSLLCALVYTTICFIPVYYLYQKKIFIKL